MIVGIVADLWRYPVKSFGGERLRRAFLGPFGVLGDRRHALLDAAGVPLTARKARRLLGWSARYADREAAEGLVVIGPDGEETTLDDPALGEALADRAGGAPPRPVRGPAGFHDAANVHLVTDASLRKLGEWLGEQPDARRFRPNVVVELDVPQPFAEDAWRGSRLRIGEAAAVAVVAPTERCAVTTFDPDTLERDVRVLGALARRRENLFGVYAQVVTPGWIAVGDPIALDP